MATGDLLKSVTPVSVRTLAGYLVLFKLAKDIADLETFLEVVILICINHLKVFATVEDDSVILVVRLSISKDWVTRKLDSEFRPPLSGLTVELGVAIDQCGKEPRISPFFLGWFILEVRDLEFRICTEKVFSVLVFLLVEL
jgi:hypothetical protein